MLVLVTYATEAYKPAAEVLRYSALRTGGFDRVLIYDEADINSPVGGRCYSWKPGVIIAALETCQDEDVLVYADATMEFQQPFLPCLKAGLDVQLFSIGDAAEKGYTNEAYTKPKCLEVMQCTEAERKGLQVNAALQAYTVSPVAKTFLAKYASRCCEVDCVGHDPAWPLHRHDQSILSILATREDQASSIQTNRDPTQHGKEGYRPVLHHRQMLRKMQTVVVVTPTTGRDIPSLLRCIQSVERQSVVCLRHLVVCDGKDATTATLHMRKSFSLVQWMDLPYPLGRNRWNGHRVYGCAPFLAAAAHNQGPAQMIAYLDEDNWYQPDHLQGLLDKMLDEKLDAVHSLRQIWSNSNKHICDDNCESLGQLAPATNGGYFLADTSTWLLKHSAAVLAAKCWDVQARDPKRPEADRALTDFLMSGDFKLGTVPKHTLNYTVGSAPWSVQAPYFTDANPIRRYCFSKPCLYLFLFGPQQTADFFATQFDTSKSHLLDEWNQNQCRALHAHFNLVNGFKFGSTHHLPHGAAALIHLCQPQELPLKMLADRKDLRRLLYTAESPNARHRQQWDWAFLTQVADDLITYWEPMFNSPKMRVHRFPHNCHHLDEENPLDIQQLRNNTGQLGTVCIVLENRPGLEGYEVNGINLSKLDGMRSDWARRLGEQGLDVTVHGKGWLEGTGPWRVGGSVGKYKDTQHAVDILQHHSACLVVENCNAKGYVSEKFYDALMAGAVPIFYNGQETDLPREVHFNLATDSITSITPESLQRKRTAVLRLRQDILHTVSAQAYARKVLSVLQTT